MIKSLQSHEVATKYSQFISHMLALWPRRKEWAHCYRQDILLRGNHTNNFAEAGIKILKEIVFSRVKAYNLVQIFHFLTDTMEAYYCRKLLSVSNNRLDTYIAHHFQGCNSSEGYIKEIDGTNKEFHVRSTTQQDVVYTVDMVLGGRKGQIRHGRRIAVQATAAGRRRCGIARGSARVIPGKPAGGSAALYNKEYSRYILPTRRQSKGKRPHSLDVSVIKGHQNAGKW